MNKIVIINPNHPHYGERGVVVRKDEPLSLAFLGKMDRIRNDAGDEFFAKYPDDYALQGRWEKE